MKHCTEKRSTLREMQRVSFTRWFQNTLEISVVFYSDKLSFVINVFSTAFPWFSPPQNPPCLKNKQLCSSKWSTCKKWGAGWFGWEISEMMFLGRWLRSLSTGINNTKSVNYLVRNHRVNLTRSVIIKGERSHEHCFTDLGVGMCYRNGEKLHSGDRLILV